MTITFPNLGNANFAAKALFDGMNLDYVIPPISNKKALEIGSYYSPEEMCLPFKIILGNYIQSIEKGADTVLITGSCGPCRFGEYPELHMNILKKLGYDINFIVIDNPKSIGMKELLKRFSLISKESNVSTKDKFKTLLHAKKVVNLMDEIEQKCRYLVGYEVYKGSFKNLLRNCKLDAYKYNNPQEMIELLKKYKHSVDNIKIDKNKNPLEVALIGEIYTLQEPFANSYIEDKLMDYGVSTKKYLSPSFCVKDAALSPFKLNSLELKNASKKYLPYSIGGYGRECVGEAVISANKGFDGAIHIFPVGCMPEIVSKSILPTIAKDKDFPIMSLIFDEMTGEAGLVTRLEAFLDLLERRNSHVLYGS